MGADLAKLNFDEFQDKANLCGPPSRRILPEEDSNDEPINMRLRQHHRMPKFDSNNNNPLRLKRHPPGSYVFDHYKVVCKIGKGSVSTIYAVTRNTKKTNKRNWRIIPRRGLCALGGKSTIDVAHDQGKHCNKSRNDVDDDRRDETKKHIDSVDTASSSTNDKLYALKVVLKEDYVIEEMKNEISILQSLSHPNIVKIFECFDYRNEACMVMELCSGGDLYSRQPYTEKEAARIVSKLLGAISYLHNHDVVHRDVKFENILFEDKSPTAQIKLVDFGLSKKYLSGRNWYPMTEKCGTAYTMAPEVLDGMYSSQVDVWGVGVVAYMLLCGEKPFWADARDEIEDQIRRCDYNFDGPRWTSVSAEAKRFVSTLLRPDPHRRPTARGALRSVWLKTRYPRAARRPDDSVMSSVHSSLTSHAFHQSTLKRLAMLVIAQGSTTREVGSLREAFVQYDTNNDGTISLSDFKKALEQQQSGGENRDGTTITTEDAEKVFHALDWDNSGELDYNAFVASTLASHSAIPMSKLKEAFNHLDVANRCMITRESLRSLLGPKYTEEMIEEIIEEVDADRDGQVSFQDFLTAFREEEIELDTPQQAGDSTSFED